jgi:hypothetical protein
VLFFVVGLAGRRELFAPAFVGGGRGGGVHLPECQETEDRKDMPDWIYLC